ncbi:TetR/AcrR family transcriptional regulator [Phaeacidiphilus oryzae]|uniref:TetR/AcrR family transcriptional regulator n=1 Tax=Phaeacidiphilus oryzae TaxID=348818 RepID=UPI00055DDC55|nr:TetR/AcrR family transcriptional regulator [Phaeacidiphilus oryzae]
MSTGKPLRADARRNRARVLAAAEEVFAEHGTGASTEQVARQAGVGVGTVFRHFPTKEDLLTAVFLERLRRAADEGRRLAARDDPGQAFFDFFQLSVDLAQGKNAFAEALAAHGLDPVELANRSTDESAPAVAQQLREVMDDLLRRAQQSGAVRSDVTPEEFKLVLIGAGQAAAQAGQDGAARARVAALISDGLRPR